MMKFPAQIAKVLDHVVRNAAVEGRIDSGTRAALHACMVCASNLVRYVFNVLIVNEPKHAEQLAGLERILEAMEAAVMITKTWKQMTSAERKARSAEIAAERQALIDQLRRQRQLANELLGMDVDLDDVEALLPPKTHWKYMNAANRRAYRAKIISEKQAKADYARRQDEYVRQFITFSDPVSYVECANDDDEVRSI